MTSIRHFPATYPLPDWRNFGVMLRVLLGVNVLALIGALVQASSVDQWLARFVEIAALVEPLLLATLGVLAALRDLMRRFHFRVGQLVVVEIATLLAVGQQIYWQSLGFPESAGWLRVALLTAVVTGLMLFYFELRARAFSPAQSEARLAALNARIRPHFLFNSLNAVLSLIRARPQQAEAALESLSDLFRARCAILVSWSASLTRSPSGNNIWPWKNCVWVKGLRSTGKSRVILARFRFRP
jgi:two-component system sensor histidine kinase AlgZ